MRQRMRRVWKVRRTRPAVEVVVQSLEVGADSTVREVLITARAVSIQLP